MDEAQAQEIRNSIRNARFNITDAQGHQTSDSNKRKDGDYFGRLTFVKSGGESLMGFYDDLMVDYPGVFKAVTGSDDAANVLNDFMKGTAKQETSLGDYMRANPEAEAELRAAITDLSSELTGKLFGIAEQSGKQMRLRQTSDGKWYVQADRKVLTGSDPSVWAVQIDSYITNMVKENGKIDIVTQDGNAITIDSKHTAWKMSYHDPQYSDSEFGIKGRAAVHVDELASIVDTSGKTVADKGFKHDNFSQYGWKYPVVFFQDFDGSHYKLTLSAALSENGVTLYNIGKIEQRKFGDVSGSSENIGATVTEPLEHSMPNGDRNVKQFRLRPALQAGKERIASVTPDDAAAIVAQIKPVGLRSLLDPVRMMDRSAADQKTRQLLHEVLEKPFNEAGGEYGRNLQKRSDEVIAKMKEWGIGKKESQAIQRYGEGVYQDAFGEPQPYTETMLRRDFPENSAACAYRRC